MNKPFSIFFMLLTFSVILELEARQIASLKVELEERPLFSFPVQVALDPITHTADSLLSLLEISQEGEQPIEFQIENTSNGRILYWMIGKDNESLTREFILRAEKRESKLPFLTANMDDKYIVLKKSGKDLWQYNHAVAKVPDGVDRAYERSGFVHPFYSPSGKRLTRIQPPDHYHHYGLWNPWTRALYEGDTVDFWNIRDGQGTVRYANAISRVNGSVFTGYEVLHEHVVLKNRDEPHVAMVETQGTKIFAIPGEDDYYLADISISLNPATENEVVLLEYRYGSLGWRATEKWDRHNSEVLTSEGLGRVEADGSLATWCIVQGEIDEDYAGVVMMSHPTNYNHPEPLRIWPIDMYDRGDMYANFAPTKDKDWIIKPGNKHMLNYRFLVTSKKISAEEAEQCWKYFANPPQVKVSVTRQK
ncbi:DUF6807 domain-containing protein [Pleomorphovibrio marinus]|uniref:DUF6807 domain-containing protein n=1 Tax=Pleomorphovibrio marinus TaxID=2164132 RepID=UPI001E37B8E5|nr:PmoA family protein [Pleomorphovibrio marinus]